MRGVVADGASVAAAAGKGMRLALEKRVVSCAASVVSSASAMVSKRRRRRRPDTAPDCRGHSDKNGTENGKHSYRSGERRPAELVNNCAAAVESDPDSFSVLWSRGEQTYCAQTRGHTAR